MAVVLVLEPTLLLWRRRKGEADTAATWVFRTAGFNLPASLGRAVPLPGHQHSHTGNKEGNGTEMLEVLTDYQIWVSLLTLTALEIVLGIDNLIFLSIVSGRLPKHQQPTARKLGLALALLGRLALLFSLTWIIGLTEPIASILGFDHGLRHDYYPGR
jgi:hypothetical protein